MHVSILRMRLGGIRLRLELRKSDRKWLCVGAVAVKGVAVGKKMPPRASLGRRKEALRRDGDRAEEDGWAVW